MDDSIFHRLYEEYHQDVFGFLIYLIGDREQAEDLVHEVYVRVLKAYDRFEGKSSEKTWLFSIAKNVSIDYFRKKAVRKKRVFESFDWEAYEIPAAEKLPEEWLSLEEEKSELLRALQTCSADQKMVVILRFFQDLSIAETAQALDWTESKVKTTQHRAIKTLRQKVNLQERGNAYDK